MKRTLEHDRSEGFSAVEVLIAAAIIAVALLAMATMFPVGYTNVAQSGKRTAAVNLAQQRIEELRNQVYTSAALNPGTTTVNLAGDYLGYTRTTTIVQDPCLQPTCPPNTPVVGVKQVTVTVTTPIGATVTVTSLVAQ